YLLPETFLPQQVYGGGENKSVFQLHGKDIGSFALTCIAPNFEAWFADKRGEVIEQWVPIQVEELDKETMEIIQAKAKGNVELERKLIAFYQSCAYGPRSSNK